MGSGPTEVGEAVGFFVGLWGSHRFTRGVVGQYATRDQALSPRPGTRGCSCKASLQRTLEQGVDRGGLNSPDLIRMENPHGRRESGG